jgi:hypothetical protein
MAAIGTIGVILSAIDLLKEVLDRAGVDPSKTAQIIGEFVSKMKAKAGRTESADQMMDMGSASLQESWEYGVLTLSYQKPWRGTRSLVPTLKDGIRMPEAQSIELAAYLNQASEDGWEIMRALGGEEAPTLILRRQKRLA